MKKSDAIRRLNKLAREASNRCSLEEAGAYYYSVSAIKLMNKSIFTNKELEALIRMVTFCCITNDGSLPYKEAEILIKKLKQCMKS